MASHTSLESSLESKPSGLQRLELDRGRYSITVRARARDPLSPGAAVITPTITNKGRVGAIVRTHHSVEAIEETQKQNATKRRMAM
jgi:hypothetical protein